MLNLMCFLATAAADPLDGPVLEGEASKLFGHNVRDMLLLGGMILALAGTLFLYAYITRKKRRVTLGLAGSRAIYRAEPEEEDSERRRHRKKRRKSSHPELLPRNPTLQETGGLPPLRPEEPAEPTQ
jgi:hypothetical protein